MSLASDPNNKEGLLQLDVSYVKELFNDFKWGYEYSDSIYPSNILQFTTDRN